MATNKCARFNTLMPGTSIEHQARAIIESHSHFVGRGRLFDFDCCDDVLVVRGTVPTYYLKQMLQHALRGLDGVRRVDNQVSVAAYDGLFAPEVRRSLR